MKVITKDIDDFWEPNIFMPIRDKIDYARVILFSARFLLLNINSTTPNCSCKLRVIIDKMSRLFFYKNDKYYSISFPFSITIENEQIIQLRTQSGMNVDFANLSSAISIIEHDAFKLNPSAIEFWLEGDAHYEIGLLLIEQIFQTEPAYIRYDIDEKNQNGRIHPLIHLDVNYSSYGTYKLGLEKNIDDSIFESIMNINTNCSYLSH